MWIPTIFLNLEQGLQQSVDLFSGKITADHLFRLLEEFAEAAADFLPPGSEEYDGVLPIVVRLVAADQAGILHFPEDRRQRRRIDQAAVGDLPLKRVGMAHQVVDHLRLAGQQRRIFLPQPGEKPFLKQRVRRQKIVMQRVRKI